jgi:hypothetical protein
MVTDRRRCASSVVAGFVPGNDGEVFDPESFRSEILPGLQNVRTVDVSGLIGLSAPYCAQIKNGGRVPHPIHWRTLRNGISAAG